MNEILVLLKLSVDAFYLGKDTEGWETFSKLMEVIQTSFADENLDENTRMHLMTFIAEFDYVTELKNQNNYTLLADTLAETHSKLMIIKENN